VQAGETSIDVTWQAPTYAWEIRNGRRVVTELRGTAAVQARIQTRYQSSAAAGGTSAYGRGTTREDQAGGNVDPRSTRLRFHEGSHGLNAVEYLESNPAPAFTGRVGMTEAAFLAARRRWQQAMREYGVAVKNHSFQRTDCAGTSIDTFEQGQAGAGGHAQIQCQP
jgi:hypothetical protein